VQAAEDGSVLEDEISLQGETRFGSP
jgi:hypothetical protein